MSQNIESTLVENRVFKPAKEFSKKARVQSLAQYREMWEESIKKPDKFWAREASELDISTKPKPRGRPVSRSLISETFSTVP